MCLTLTPDEDAVYQEYLRRYIRDGSFHGDIADQLAASCTMSRERAQAAVSGLFEKGKISLIHDPGEEQTKNRIDRDISASGFPEGR
jgi:hypothetical protein